jgi:hypothetical protein
MQGGESLASQELSARRYQIEGHELGYPTGFRDGCAAAGLFVVDAGVADDLIAESGFRVARIAPGRALLALTCVHYTESDCGAYQEIAMAFFVEKVDAGWRVPYLGNWSDILRSRVASYTWKLQVTTVLSQQCGLRMWGFPKTLEEIDFDLSGGRARFTLRMEGREVLDYSVPAEGRRRPAPVTSPVYSIFEGAQHLSHLSQEYRDVGVRPGAGELRLGDAPLAQQLRSLGLPRRPLLATWMGHLAFRMSAPRKL